MIAVDTNVLLRYLLRDDEEQAKRAYLLLRGTATVLVTDVVLAETVWTLMGRRYRASKSDIISVIEGLLDEPRVRFEDDTVVWRALQAYRDTDAGFADALIVYKALKSRRLEANRLTRYAPLTRRPDSCRILGNHRAAGGVPTTGKDGQCRIREVAAQER